MKRRKVFQKIIDCLVSQETLCPTECNDEGFSSKLLGPSVEMVVSVDMLSTHILF